MAFLLIVMEGFSFHEKDQAIQELTRTRFLISLPQATHSCSAEPSDSFVQQTTDGASGRHAHGDIQITEDRPQESHMFLGPDMTKRPDGRNARPWRLVM